MSPSATIEIKTVPGTLAVHVVPKRTREGRPLGRTRGDLLPEQTRYRDDGCDVHPSCLTCPLPRCRYEQRGGLRGMMNAYRDRQVLELREEGIEVPELSERFGLSRRTIFRILENAARRRQAERRTPVPIYLRRRKSEEAQCA
jgi:hypothetical protein